MYIYYIFIFLIYSFHCYYVLLYFFSLLYFLVQLFYCSVLFCTFFIYLLYLFTQHSTNLFSLIMILFDCVVDTHTLASTAVHYQRVVCVLFKGGGFNAFPFVHLFAGKFWLLLTVLGRMHRWEQ